MLSLSPVEARVVGCLIEKEITTPEYYPLSLNALVNACNQKSSRDPIMELSEADVRSALFELENRGLVRVLADGSRAQVRASALQQADPLQASARRGGRDVPSAATRGPQTRSRAAFGRADRLVQRSTITQAVQGHPGASRRPRGTSRSYGMMARQPGCA